jgi:hypothetical protein
MTSLHHDIRSAFDFLLERGYSLIESPGGMGGTVAYRSPALWISIEWDRLWPWMTFTFVRSGPEPLSWTEVNSLLRTTPDGTNSQLPASPSVQELSAFVKENIQSIERLVQTDEWPRTERCIRDALARRYSQRRTHR